VGDDPAAFEALLTADLPDGWRTAVAYWHLVRFPARPWTHWDGVNRLELLRHLLAAGQFDGRRNPTTWGMSDEQWIDFQYQATQYYFTLGPPDGARTREVADVVRRLPTGPDRHHEATFNGAPPGQGVAQLPFAVVADLLRVYARMLPELGHWVQYDTRREWADRLWRAWRRAPDRRAAVAALTDPDERVREVMRLFCQMEYVPELLRRVRQRSKTAGPAEADALADVLAVWDAPQDRVRLAGRPRPAPPDRSPPWDPARPAAERLAAAERDADSRDAAARWYFLLSPDERLALPPAVRVRFAVALIDGNGWSEDGWPLLGWLATVPDGERVSAWLGGGGRAEAAGAVLLSALGTDYLRPMELTLMHALDHPDDGLRAAARSGYVAAARLDAALCDRLLDRAAPFVRPPAFDELVAACRDAGEAAADGPPLPGGPAT